MTALPAPGPPLEAVGDQPAETRVGGATARAVLNWLSADAPRPLAVVGPVGIGKTTLLRWLSDELSACDDTVALSCPTVAGEGPADLLRRARCAVEAHRRSTPHRRAVLLVDDVDRVAAADRNGLLAALRRNPQVRLVMTSTSATGLGDVIVLEVPALAGALDVSVADFALLQGSRLGRFFLDGVRRHNPVVQPDAADCGRVSEICGSSFGIPSDVALLAELVDQYGLPAVADAVTEARPRQRLAMLVEDLGIPRPPLGADEVLVLASVFASPGGASVDMLRDSLPRCDVDDAARQLTARGMLVRAVRPADDEVVAVPDRYHLRVSATHVGSWCAAQTEVSFAAIRHAQADHLHERIRRMAADVHGPTQPAAFAEFRSELPNLRCAVAELIATARYPQAVSLLADAMPLLTRIGGVDVVLPELLEIVRAYEPREPAEREQLASVAVRVFAAGGELEVAASYLDPPGAGHEGSGSGEGGDVVPRMVTSDREATAADMAALERCMQGHRATRDMAALTEVAGEYLPRLMRARELEQAEVACRQVLSDASRSGDDYLAGLILLWRAVVACATEPDDAGTFVERALRKLRPLGADAVLSAVSGVVASRHLRALTQRSVDLAMLIAALSRAECLGPGTPGALVVAAAERRIAQAIGSRAAHRWAVAGAEADPVQLLVELLRRRWVESSSAGVELRHSGGVATTPAVDAERLSGCSQLTPREAEVASLVATGLTNKQVAFRLHISEWTVINHLRQVMRKLDCTSRVQVARWVSLRSPDELQA